MLIYQNQDLAIYQAAPGLGKMEHMVGHCFFTPNEGVQKLMSDIPKSPAILVICRSYRNSIDIKTPYILKHLCEHVLPFLRMCVLCFAHPNIPIPIAEIRIPTYPKIALLPPQRPKISPEKNDDWKMIYLYIYIHMSIYIFIIYFQLKHEPLF